MAAGVVLVARSSISSASPPPAPKPPRVISLSPAPGATDADANDPIAIHFSEPLNKDTPLPTISPPVPGSWSLQDHATTLVFIPREDFTPSATVSLTVPAGSAGIRSVEKTTMATTVSDSWTIQPGSTLRLQQLLAELNYLPVSFTPNRQAPSAPAGLTPELGSFAWRFPHLPPQLQALWQPGVDNVVTSGALMSFESGHGLASDGRLTPDVWLTLLSAATAHQMDPNPYSYALVTQTSRPQTLTVFQNGDLSYSTPANTGISDSPTPDGTWPVYERFRVTTMSGTNPDGSYYSDPGIPWVSYFHGGDAIHGFDRGSYGSPQSLGCVELPYQAAAAIWPMTPLGTLVTVS